MEVKEPCLRDIPCRVCVRKLNKGKVKKEGERGEEKDTCAGVWVFHAVLLNMLLN